MQLTATPAPVVVSEAEGPAEEEQQGAAPLSANASICRKQWQARGRRKRRRPHPRRRGAGGWRRPHTVVADDGEHPDMPGYSPFDLVTVTLKDGRKLESQPITAVRGGPDLPLSREVARLWLEDRTAVADTEDFTRMAGYRPEDHL